MELQLIAYHLEKQIDLSKTREYFNTLTLVKREHTFLLYEIDTNSFLYVKDYGSIVFLNCDNKLIASTFDFFLTSQKDINQLPYEEYKITFSNTIEVDFGIIQLKELTTDVAHIICLNLAQSVALMNYVNKTSELYENTLVYSKQLENTGSFKLSKTRMRKFIGKTMNLKNNIEENLFVFDSPDVAWNNKDLSVLDYKLKDELDIVKRHNSINNSLNAIKENLDYFSDILHHKYSSTLEWIIILLILFEIVQVLFEKLF